MKLLVATCCAAACLASTTARAPAQSPVPNDPHNPQVQLDAIAKKLEEQSAKLDVLSQHLLKIEQQLSNGGKPGVIIGEPTPPATPAPASSPPAAAAGANSHVVARGETLTGIAKMYKVGVEELQKFNNIENDRKLQIGQTIKIPPTASGPPAVASPSLTPPPPSP